MGLERVCVPAAVKGAEGVCEVASSSRFEEGEGGYVTHPAWACEEDERYLAAAGDKARVDVARG